MTKIETWKEKARKAEDKRVGDIYAECIVRGCTRRFLEVYDTRIWVSPVQQTKTFLSIAKGNKYSSDIENRLKQWKTYLEVILEKRPDHEKANEWKESLKLLK